MRIWAVATAVVLAWPAWAQDTDLGAIVEGHILPGYQALKDETAALKLAAAEDCAPDVPALVAAYHDAFDAWVRVSHLRFGPSEKDDRAFALAFWPDPRGSTPKTLAALTRDEDPVVDDPDAFATVSVAARGFYAMEFLLFDAQFREVENADYHCALVRAVSTDIAGNAAAILEDWQTEYGALLSEPQSGPYRTQTEAAQQLFTALSTGLQFTSEARLGRPMGTLERPRPNRAEARRSERSLRHVILSLEATMDLTRLLVDDNPEVMQAFQIALDRARGLDDPVFAGVATPQGRFRVEVLQQDINEVRQILAEEVGPRLGVAAGFNSLDGD